MYFSMSQIHILYNGFLSVEINNYTPPPLSCGAYQILNLLTFQIIPKCHQFPLYQLKTLPKLNSIIISQYIESKKM